MADNSLRTSDNSDLSEEELEEEEEPDVLDSSMTSEGEAGEVKRAPYIRHLSEGLARLWVTKAHSDLTVHVENRVFQCHKALLFAISPYFDAMFSSGMREAVSGEVTFKEMEADIFEQVLEYIYTGKDIVSEKNVIKLLKASSVLQIESLCTKCEDFLEPFIDNDNCLALWKMSLIHGCEKVKVKAFNLILIHFMELSRCDEFMKLDAYEIIQLIQNDNLNVPAEEDVYDVILQWVNADEKVRKPKLGQIFCNIRLGHLSAERLAILKSSSSPVAGDADAQKYLDEAISYKLLHGRRQEANAPLSYFRHCWLQEEVLVILGGCFSMVPPYDRCKDVLAFSFVQQKWFKLENLPYDPGIEFATCGYGNDIFVTGGGSTTQTFLRFRSDKNKWKIGNPLLCGRRRHVMVAMTNCIYVLGGYDHRLEEGSRMLSSVEMYDMREDKWMNDGKLFIPVSSFSSAVAGEKIYLFGGERNDKTDTGLIQCFDTRTKACSKIVTMPIISKLTKSVTSGQRIFVIFFSGRVVEFNPETRKCKLVGLVKDFRRIHYGAVQYRGDVFIVGGENEDTSLTKEVICYRVNTGQSDKTQKALPSPRLIDSCVKIAIHKRYLTDEKCDGEDGADETNTT